MCNTIATSQGLTPAIISRPDCRGGAPAILRDHRGLARTTVLLAANLVCIVVIWHRSARGVLAMIAIAASSVLSSIAGFAFSPLCGSLLFRINTDPVAVVKTILICSIASQAAMTWQLRRTIDWQGLRVYLAGGACGLLCGVWVLLNVNRRYYQDGLGVILAAYGLFMLFRKPILLRCDSRVLDFGSGLLSGVTGGAAGFPSGFVSIWCSMKGWDKARQRSMCQPFVLFMQVSALLVLSFARGGGRFNTSDLLYVPASLLGTTIGMALYRRLSDIHFGQYMNGMLVVSGLGYLL